MAGNSAVVKMGETFEYTEEMIRELVRCKNDILYFAENYVYVIHPKRGKIRLELRDYQWDLLRDFVENKNLCILSSRQSGKTTCSCIFLLWYAMFNQDKCCAILANMDRTATNILTDIKDMYEELPMWMKPATKEYNKHSIVFENGSKIFSSATSKNALRGESISVLFCDEFAFVEPATLADDFWASNLPTVEEGEKVIVVSTPNGVGNLYHKLWTDAVNKRNSFKAVRIDYWQVPGRDEEWKEQKIKDIGTVRFASEYGNSFIGSSSTLIHADSLKELVPVDPIMKEEMFGGDLFTFEEYKEGELYIASNDIGLGTGSDYSTSQIFRVEWREPNEEDIRGFIDKGIEEEDIPDAMVTNLVQALTFRSNLITIPDFCSLTFKLLPKWGNPAFIFENNGIGQSFLDQMNEKYYYENAFVYQDSPHFGINSNVHTKTVMVNALKEYIENDKSEIVDDRLISELLTFIEKRSTSGNRKFTAEDGNNDDLAVGIGWACFLANTLWFQDFLLY
jgi:hypothetical protein